MPVYEGTRSRVLAVNQAIANKAIPVKKAQLLEVIFFLLSFIVGNKHGLYMIVEIFVVAMMRYTATAAATRLVRGAYVDAVATTIMWVTLLWMYPSRAPAYFLYMAISYKKVVGY
jgi:hypothetical protein